jgi:hypothetical protein
LKYFIGKTDVKFSTQYIAGSYKFYWNLNIYKRIKYLLIVFISIFFFSCTGDKISKKQINNIILIYQDENKSYILREEYWYNIIDKLNKSKFSTTNVYDFFVKRYKISQPIYTFKIKYEWGNGTEIKIELWENLLNINNMWYEATNESIEIFSVIDKIITENCETNDKK